MSDDINNIPVPILIPHQDQKLIVNFIRSPEGKDCITFSFDPEIPEVRTPAQAAAVNVANHIIRSFALGQEQQPEGETNGEEAIN